MIYPSKHKVLLILILFLSYSCCLFSKSNSKAYRFQNSNEIIVANVITSFKLKIGKRAKKIKQQEHLSTEDGLEEQLRTWYRVSRAEYIVAAYDNIPFVSFSKSYSEGIIFTDQQIIVRKEKKLTNLPYSYLKRNCKFEWDDDYVKIYDKTDEGYWKISVDESDITPFEMSSLMDDIVYALYDARIAEMKRAAEKRKARLAEERAAEIERIRKEKFYDKIEYTNGLYDSKKYKKALSIYYKNRDSELFSAVAQNNLGNIYFKGLGIKKNEEEGIKWYRAAAARGNKNAQYNLGYAYYFGYGVSQDFEKAREWFKKASYKHYSSDYMLGIIYSRGKGVKKDIGKAHNYFFESAKEGYEYAQYEVGIYLLRKSSRSSRGNYKKAYDWLSKAAEKNHAGAQNSLGYIYDKGLIGEKDFEKAFDWYEKSANNNNSYGQNNLGIMYLEGKHVNIDYAQAMTWFLESAESGNRNAMANIGYMYFHGLGTEMDFEKAKIWCTKAANLGSSLGQQVLKELELEGNNLVTYK